MIRVELQPEPKPPEFDFDRLVRKPGQAALAAARGEKAQKRGKGRPRKQNVIINADFLRERDYWTAALDILCHKYGHICAYSCFRIWPTQGPTVDHFVAITRAEPEYAYEWTNYRLASGLMNSRKNHFDDVLDPCKIQDGWFALNLATLEVVPGKDLDPAVEVSVQQTIDRLRLNSPECVLQREQHLNDYLRTDIPSVPFWCLERDAPFLARELIRQGWLRQGDTKLTPTASHELTASVSASP